MVDCLPILLEILHLLHHLPEHLRAILRRITILYQANLDIKFQLITDNLVVQPVGKRRFRFISWDSTGNYCRCRLTFSFMGDIITASRIGVSVPIAPDHGQTENRKSGSMPERYRHCMCGVCTQDENQPLGKPEKAVCKAWMHKPGDLLKLFWSACFRVELHPFECGKTAVRGSLTAVLFWS